MQNEQNTLDAAVLDEFPAGASDWPQDASRRDFLKLMGASLALAGVEGCTRQPAEPIVPYVRSPEQMVPGKPLFYATAMPFGEIVEPVLAESHMGRPTKIEGNPEHPASLGSTSIFAQASVLTLYDPDRAQVITHQGQISTLAAFEAAMQELLSLLQKSGGRGLRLVSGPMGSPSLIRQIDGLLRQYPESRWVQHDPLASARDTGAFDRRVRPIYRLAKAKCVVSLDADFLSCLPGQIGYARDFANGRHVHSTADSMIRLYVAEPTPTVTGATADQRVAASPGEIQRLALALAAEIGIGPKVDFSLDAALRAWLSNAARVLAAHRGASLVVAGERQPRIVHALADAINKELGNNGHSVEYLDRSVFLPKAPPHSLAELTEEMRSGHVKLLIILNCNPAYNAPSNLDFEKALSKVPHSVALSLFADETARLCHWHIPGLHYLESWSDGRAYDGSVCLIQPLIAPLYHGQSVHEFLNRFAAEPEQSAYDIVRRTWRERVGAADFDRRWQVWLHDGKVPEGAAEPFEPTILANWRELYGQGIEEVKQDRGDSLSLVLAPDPTIHDGEWANNGWLQELPKPLTKLTWDNAALLDADTARRIGVSNEDVIELSVGERHVKAPVWIQPGQARGCITLHLGYGRRHAGRNASGVGANAYRLRSSKFPWFASVEIHRTNERYALACTQAHYSMEDRDLIRTSTLGAHNSGKPHAPSIPLTLYPVHSQDQYSWGMVIDLNTCTGCGACTIACQAENNIPIVGKEQVIHSREMHWIRVDRYFRGSEDNPEMLFQPVPCMHCEYAPCEIVCPVAATSHSEEGLNEMTYNRCVGTRYCANNCPYKVRRFNFLKYNDEDTAVLKLQRNPDVTVRSRGVMEKCTYCVQRISAARIEAKKEDRSIRDGEIVTACEAVCPSQAIVFGNLNDSHSRIARLRALPDNYGLLDHLNTRPRTTYLPRYVQREEEPKPA